MLHLRMQRKKQRAAEAAKQEARDAQECLLARLLQPDTMEHLGIHLHRLLQLYPNVRDKWLGGQSLGHLISESCFGAALLCHC